MGVAVARLGIRGRGNTSPLPDQGEPVLLAEVVAEQRIVARLEHAGAVTAESARPLAGLSPVEAASLEALLRARLVREGSAGSYYVDRTGLPPQRRARQVFAGFVFVLVALVTLALAVIGVLVVAR